MAETTTGARQLLRAGIPLLVVGGLALAAGAASLGNGFAYDDIHLVVQNGRVHHLASLPARLIETYWPEVPLAGEGRLYRPLTVIGFGLQWAIGRGTPLIFHLASVLMYALVALLVYALARRFLPTGPAALAGALFAVHPVHVEAWANVVGQGELLVAAFLLIGVVLYVDGRRVGFSQRRIGAIAGCFAAGLLSKEHAVAFPLLLLALEPALPAESRPRARVLVTPLVLTAVAWLALRTLVTGSFGGESPHPAWHGVGLPLRVLTMLGVVPLWARLLVWPADLSADYSPRETSVASGFGPEQFTGVWILLLAVYLGYRFRRLAPATSAGMLWLGLALLPVANLLAPTGIIAAERTLFLPSVGLVLAVGALVNLWAEERSEAGRVFGGLLVLLLLGLGVWRSATRAPVWRDNRTLFSQTILDAPRSYWAWRNYAGQMVLDGREAEARGAYAVAEGLFDRDPQLHDDRASFERRFGHCDRAVPHFRIALALDPDRHMTAARLIGCLTYLKRYDEARAVAADRLERGRGEFAAIRAMVDSAEAVTHLPDSSRPASPLLLPPDVP
jgi:hypothetical protein